MDECHHFTDYHKSLFKLSVSCVCICEAHDIHRHDPLTLIYSLNCRQSLAARAATLGEPGAIAMSDRPSAHREVSGGGDIVRPAK